jgi:hypothetical protein
MIIEFFKKYTVHFVIALGLAFAVYTLFRSREGFQNSTTANKSTPAACSMIKLIVERAQKNLENAQQTDDKENIGKLQRSLDNIMTEMKGMSC